MGLCVHTALALPGSGTQQDPYRIQSLADFDEFAAYPNYWAGFTRLETDVNLAGRTYTTAVIAPDTDSSTSWFQGTPFTGVFDGNDHKIVNLTINGGAVNDFLGLFGYIDDGEVKNLGIEVGSVSGTGLYVGGLVGLNYGSLSNCYSTGDVNSLEYVGGLVGLNDGGYVSNCSSTCDVSGISRVGGLVGANNGSVLNCYSTGNVSGVAEVGGLLGYNNGSILNCYSIVSVIGTEDVGGLVGWNDGTISNCYSTGDVNGGGNVGGLIGQNDEGSISNCFWDKDTQTHGVTESIGENYGTVTNVSGLTNAQMQTRSTFTDAGWDFVEIWLINNGATYPVLRQEIRSDLNGDDGVDMLDFAIFADHWLEEK